MASTRRWKTFMGRIHVLRIKGQNLNFYLELTQPRITFTSHGYEIWLETRYILLACGLNQTCTYVHSIYQFASRFCIDLPDRCVKSAAELLP